MHPRIENAATLLPESLKALFALNASTAKAGLPQVTIDLVHLRAWHDRVSARPSAQA